METKFSYKYPYKEKFSINIKINNGEEQIREKKNTANEIRNEEMNQQILNKFCFFIAIY